MKKLICGLSPFALAVSAFAEGAAGGSGNSLTISTADASEVANAVTAWANGIAPVVLTVVGGFLGFWAIKVGIRIIKGIAGSSK